MTDFEDLPLSAPARRALEAEGLTSLELLAARTRDEVAEVRGIAPGTVAILEDALQARGLSFAEAGVPAADASAAEVSQVVAPVEPVAASAPAPSALPTYNVFAIVALATSFVLPIVGVIFGHLALRELKTTGQQGREMAIAGLVVGYALSAAYLLAIFVTLAFSFMMMLVPLALIPISMMGY